MTDRELVDLACGMRALAYAPYSGYRVGAALLCRDGSVVTGCNIENVSYGATICAERTALAKAISEGKTDFVKLAVCASGDAPASPCGICRQTISEFTSDDFEILCANEKGNYQVYTLAQLLPNAFALKGRGDDK